MEPTTIRCKFLCVEKITFQTGDSKVNFSAVIASSDPVNKENEDFATATPGGSLELYISPNTKAAGYFEPGREYYLSIVEAPVAVPAE